MGVKLSTPVTCPTCSAAFVRLSGMQRYCTPACSPWPHGRRKGVYKKPRPRDTNWVPFPKRCLRCDVEFLPAACGACVRGLLCRACNQALGNLNDDLERILNLATYLLSFRSVLPGEADRDTSTFTMPAS